MENATASPREALAYLRISEEEDGGNRHCDAQGGGCIPAYVGGGSCAAPLPGSGTQILQGRPAKSDLPLDGCPCISGRQHVSTLGRSARRSVSIEAYRIAARLAQEPWVPLSPSIIRDGKVVPNSTASVEAEGDVITVTVTDADGAKREYRAQVQLVGTSSAMPTAPVVPGAATSGGSRCNQPSTESR
ncbi:Uncharacterised protein [Mycobacteroides abscessus subsp. abscessus]|nr:Uncharacterised protein [Mycobacteroides abscessus subsp. abscessus]SHT60446.1 Uncharacterised protein [Mycobacteroides abscessus subsp. abscessus]SHU23976.1 Uncharacterised protein [Mycobacteroides abscessus subsp. abscessus]